MGKLDELETLVDQALEMLGETENVPDVYRQEFVHLILLPPIFGNSFAFHADPRYAMRVA